MPLLVFICSAQLCTHVHIFLIIKIIRCHANVLLSLRLVETELPGVGTIYIRTVLGAGRMIIEVSVLQVNALVHTVTLSIHQRGGHWCQS